MFDSWVGITEFPLHSVMLTHLLWNKDRLSDACRCNTASCRRGEPFTLPSSHAGLPHLWTIAHRPAYCAWCELHPRSRWLLHVSESDSSLATLYLPVLRPNTPITRDKDTFSLETGFVNSVFAEYIYLKKAEGSSYFLSPQYIKIHKYLSLFDLKLNLACLQFTV